MSLEEKREKPDLKSNVHFWLRKIFLFVSLAPVETVNVEEREADKGEPELILRHRLSKEGLLSDYEAAEIRKEEALEACQKLFEMFMEPFEPDVQKIIEDPSCPGGKPRGIYG